MIDPFSLKAFVEKFAETSEHPSPEEFEVLLEALSKAERPRSIRIFTWALLRTLQRSPILQSKLIEQWMPKEVDLAQLLEDAGKEGTRVFLSLQGGREELDRLWALCDDAELAHLNRSSDPWEIASLAPMAALEAERHLDELITAIANNRRWKDPAEILDPENENGEFEIEAIISLGQKRMAKMKGGSEALNLAMVRLLRHANRGDEEIN